MGSRRVVGQIERKKTGASSSYTFQNGVNESGGNVSLDLTYLRGNAYTFSNGVTHNGSGNVQFGGTITSLTFLQMQQLLQIYSDNVNGTFRVNNNVGELQISGGGTGEVRFAKYSEGHLFFNNVANKSLTFQDFRVVKKGAEYAADYSLEFVDLSWINKVYADNRIASKSVEATIKAPGAGNHLQAIVWNDTNQQWEFGNAVASPGGSANELQKNSGSSTFSGSGVFSSSSGNLTLGDTGLGGDERILGVDSSSASVDITFSNKGVGGEYNFNFTRTFDSVIHFGALASGAPNIYGTGSNVTSFTIHNALRVVYDGVTSGLLISNGIGASDSLQIVYRIADERLEIESFGTNSVTGHGNPLRIKGTTPTGTNVNGGDLIIAKGRKQGTGLDGNILVETANDQFIHIDGRKDFAAEAGASVNLGEVHRGKVVKLTNDNPTLNLSDLSDGFECVLLWVPTTPGEGTITGHASLNGDAGDLLFTNPYCLIYLVHDSNNDWIWKGDPVGGGVEEIVTNATTVNVDETYNGKLLVLTATVNQDVVLGDFQDGFQLQILKTQATGTVSFSGYTAFNSVGGVDTMTDQWGMVYLLKRGTNAWHAKGDLV